MDMARQVQESLLPPATLKPPGLSVAACFRPAQAVGGDIYDLVELPDGRLLVAIADVCGQGLPAALLSVAVQHRIRQFAQPDPAAVLAGVNQLLFEKAPDDMFATAACVVIDPRNGSAAAAVAGHPPPLRWDHTGGRLVAVRGHGPALGLQRNWTGSTEQWQLAPNDTLILYTDGVLDAKWDEQERLGDERLAELLGRAAPIDAPEWVERLRRTLDGCLELPDDVTIVAIRREPSLIPAAPRVPRVGRGGGGNAWTRRGARVEADRRKARCHRMRTRRTEKSPIVEVPRLGP
jgi:sigma-B regulation protein RsbU (phosphoserine phosphatase)